MDTLIAATVGVFDGVHCGHRYLINDLMQHAAHAGLEARVVTFDCHPAHVLHPEQVCPMLTTLEEKVRLLGDLTGSKPLILPFSRELASLSARSFMTTYLYERFGVRLLCIGYDHRFGRDRSEDFHDYEFYGRRIGMKVVRASELTVADADVSSSNIREALLSGQISRANLLLGYPYRLSGIVEGGFRNGHLIGYPTANIRPNSPEKLIPAAGVYAVRVELDDKIYGGMLYIGNRPTFDNGKHTTVEVNIFDLSANLYGKSITVNFVAYLRNDVRFNSTDALAEQLAVDARDAQGVLAQTL